eukprot:3320906-Pleurochrysis_carterae.AAC.1
MAGVQENWRCKGTAVGWMFQHIFGTRSVRCLQQTSSSSHDFISLQQFALVNVWYIGQAHHVVSVSYRRRSTVGCVGASIQAGHGERRTRR